jgi:methionyl-tRNA formyltransferase
MGKVINIAFFGTPLLSSTCLARLHSTYGVRLVITKPDKARGRGRKVSMTPVKQFALEKSIDVYQPDRVDETLIQHFSQHAINLTVVVAYGKILHKSVVHYPEHGSLNLHASLLPKYRGPSPIQAAILAGERVTGITLQIMTEKMDAGDILASESIALEDDWSAAELFAQVSQVSPQFLVRSVGEYLDGRIKPVQQNEHEATYCPVIRKDDGLINWGGHPEKLLKAVRAYNLWPVAFTFLDGKVLRVYNVKIPSHVDTGGGENGEIVLLDSQQGIIVRAGEGFVCITELQIENKKRMGYKEFMNGYRGLEGKVLGNK